MSQSQQSSSQRSCRVLRNCTCHHWTEYTLPADGPTVVADITHETSSTVFTDTVSEHCENGIWTERRTRLKANWQEVPYSHLVDKVLSGNGLLSKMIQGINEHAERKGDAFRLSNDMLGEWKLRLFFAALVAMRLFNSTVKEFWSMDPTKGCRFVAKYLSEDEFQAINRNLVFNPFADPSFADLDKDDPDYHPYAEYQEGLDKLLENFSDLVNVGNVHTLDESRVAGKATGHPFTSRDPTKPQRCGLDIFTTATYGVERVGIVEDLIPYCGKWTYDYDDESDQKEWDNVMNNVCIRILRKRCKPGDLFCCDARFTSVWLFEQAAELGIGAFGVIRHDRVCLPREFWRTADFQKFRDDAVRGTYRQYEKRNGLHVTAFWDSGKKPIWMLDNCFHPKVRIAVTRKHGKKFKSAPSGTSEDIPFPTVCFGYNTWMGAVDAANRSRSLLFIDRQSVRKSVRAHVASLEFLAFVNTADLYVDCHSVVFDRCSYSYVR